LTSQLKLAFYDFLQVSGEVGRCGTKIAINLMNRPTAVTYRSSRFTPITNDYNFIRLSLIVMRGCILSVNNLKPGSSENHIRTLGLSSEPAFFIQTINLEVALLLRQSLID